MHQFTNAMKSYFVTAKRTHIGGNEQNISNHQLCIALPPVEQLWSKEDGKYN